MRSVVNFANNFFTISASLALDEEKIVKVIHGLQYFNLAFAYSREIHDATDATSETCLSLIRNIECNMHRYMRVFLSHEYFACNFPQLKLVLQFFIRLATLSLEPCSLNNILSTFASHSHMLNTFIDTSSTTTAKSLARFIRCGEFTVSKVFNRTLFTIQHPISSFYLTRKTVDTSVPSPFVIGVDENNLYTQLQRRNNYERTNVKFRSLSTSGEFNGKVIFYCHGGGFLGPAAESLEDMYIVDLVLALPGAVIINFDYSLAPEHKFPTQIQQVLDFYLWLQSSSQEVESTFGFTPSEIILSGDSAGATLVVALTLILNDLHIDFGCSDIKMPKNIIGMFGKYHLSKSLSPGHFLSITDSLVSFVFLMRMASFMRFRIYESDKSSSNNNMDRSKWTLGYIERTSNDFSTDLTYEADPCPYLQPLNYTRFDTSELLSRIPIYLMALDSCPLIDETIQLAKVWPGRVSLTSVKSTCHAAMYFARYDPQGTQSIIDETISLHLQALRDFPDI